MTNLDQDLADLGISDATPPAAEPAKPVVSLVDQATQAVPPWVLAWRRWRDEIAKAIDGSFNTLDDLERGLAKGTLQLWPGAGCVIVTEIVSYPGGERAIQARWAAGDLAEMETMIPGLEAFGRVAGCTSVLIEGHAGWVRVLKQHGFKRFSVTLRKAL